ncbi:hypothetical protein KCP75_12040 [Salmonella enterica subsp. enterica]|nr:hypothetical protein KCP75_12040 [Salmonella enterica subsp. enterica]
MSRLESLPAADAHQLAGNGGWSFCGRRNKDTKTMTLKRIISRFLALRYAVSDDRPACVRQRETRMYPEEPFILPPRYRVVYRSRATRTVKSAALLNLCAVQLVRQAAYLCKSGDRDGRWYWNFSALTFTLHLLPVRRSVPDHGDSVDPDRTGEYKRQICVRKRGSVDFPVRANTRI